MNKVLW